MSDDSLSLFSIEGPAAASAASESERELIPRSVRRDAPLADRMRPASLDEIVGQEMLVGTDGFVRRLERSGRMPSLILHGPPGSGKTTLGRLLAGSVGARFVPFNAVSEGVPRLREIVKAARESQRAERRTLLFVDEIHRLNKGQQDFLLPFVESGLLTLVGATTEHPSFEVNAALLSRTRVLVLEPLGPEALRVLIRRALLDRERGLGALELELDVEAESELVERSGGDARQALNALEVAAELTAPGERIDAAAIREALQQHVSRYDSTTGFQLLSAFHKSVRASQGDAALYWALRMIEAGEDPMVLFRRLVAAAYEDVGLAEPQAGVVAVQAMQAFERLGSPEGLLALSNAILYVANAPKSNRAYLALSAAREAALRSSDAPVPLQLRNASTSLMKEWGFGGGYQYAHDHEDGYIPLECWPEELSGTRFYDPTERGYEGEIRTRMKQRDQLG